MYLKEIVQHLESEGYIVSINKMYVFTAKFNREISGLDLGVVVVPKPEELKVIEEVVPSEVAEQDWNVLYSNLIINAKVPSHSYGKSNETYEVNRATKPGREAFKKAMLKDKLDLQLLTEVVTNYYKANNNKFRVKIETFFTSEMWRDDYRQLEATGKIKTDNQNNVSERVKFG